MLLGGKEYRRREALYKRIILFPDYATRQPHSRNLKRYKSWQPYSNAIFSEVQKTEKEADLITFNPIFDPRGSGWYWEKDVQGYSSGQQVDRRASMGKIVRFSRSLLLAMSTLNAEEKRSSHCETWPATVVYHSNQDAWLDGSLYPFNSTSSLAKDMKAVYVPHPIYYQRDRATDELFSILQRPNFYTKSNEKVMRDASFYSENAATFPQLLYSEWSAVNNSCLAPTFLYPIRHR